MAQTTPVCSSCPPTRSHAGVLLDMLRALRDRPRACAPRVRVHIAQLLVERWSCSADAVDDSLPDALRLLTGDTADEKQVALPLWTLGKLTAQPRIAASLWPHVHSCLEPVLAPQAEQLAALLRSRAADATTRAVDLAAPLGDVVSFYALHAPGGVDAGASLLRAGIVRTASALLATLDAPQLRRGVLLACAASPAAAAFMTAVPAAHAHMQRAPGAIAALWPLVTASASGNSAASAPLCALLAEAQTGEPAKQATALEALTLLLEAMRAAGAAQPLWRNDDATHAALQGLQAALRAATSEEAPSPEAVSDGSEHAKAHTRRAALRQCLKDVLACADGCLRKKD